MLHATAQQRCWKPLRGLHAGSMHGRRGMALSARHAALLRASAVAAAGMPGHAGLAALPSTLLKGRHVTVLWDIENVKPWAPTLSIPVQVYRIQALFEFLGCSGVSFKAATNASSRQRLQATGALELLQASGVQVGSCSSFSDAADRDLISHAYMFARERGRQGAVAVISNDADFCGVMGYAASCGCFTISLAPHAFKPTAALLPGPPMHKAQLPAACHLALMWQEGPATAMAPEEQAWLRRCLDRCVEGAPGGGEEGPASGPPSSSPAAAVGVDEERRRSSQSTGQNAAMRRKTQQQQDRATGHEATTSSGDSGRRACVARSRPGSSVHAALAAAVAGRSALEVQRRVQQEQARRQSSQDMDAADLIDDDELEAYI